MNKYEIYYEGELSADDLDEAGLREYFADTRKDFETEKELGYLDADTSFKDWIQHYQVCLLVDTEPFL